MGPKWAEEVPQSGPYLPGEGFKVPDVKCFEGQSGRAERDGQEGAMGEEKGDTGRTSFGGSGPLSRLGGPLHHSLAPLEGSEDCRTSVHSCMVLCRAWVFSLST